MKFLFYAPLVILGLVLASCNKGGLTSKSSRLKDDGGFSQSDIAILNILNEIKRKPVVLISITLGLFGHFEVDNVNGFMERIASMYVDHVKATKSLDSSLLVVAVHTGRLGSLAKTARDIEEQRQLAIQSLLTKLDGPLQISLPNSARSMNEAMHKKIIFLNDANGKIKTEFSLDEENGSSSFLIIDSFGKKNGPYHIGGEKDDSTIDGIKAYRSIFLPKL